MIMAEQRKYSPSSGSDVKSEMHRYERGTAKSGSGGREGTVKSRKQAIAIGLSKARASLPKRNNPCRLQTPRHGALTIAGTSSLRALMPIC
jgi:hypothetical protein